MRRSGLRISGGAWRGQPVEAPARARPSEGRLREALFSIWQERLPGARLLDLFAGSGIVALEALSRGAASALCVDSDLAAVKAIDKSRRAFGRAAVELRRASLPGGLVPLAAERGAAFDLVFADPPYAFTAYPLLIERVAPLLAPGGEAVVEHSCRTSLPEVAGPLAAVDARRYGESCLTFYRPAAAP